jgi:hypothetical protein
MCGRSSARHRSAAIWRHGVRLTGGGYGSAVGRDGPFTNLDNPGSGYPAKIAGGVASFFTMEGKGMSTRGSTAAVGIIVGLVSFVVLGCLEVLLMKLFFGGDPSNGFGFSFVLLGAGMLLIPANIVAATLIGKGVYKEQRREAED